MIAANEVFDARLEAARARIAATGDPRPCRQDRADLLVPGYVEGSELREADLDVSATKLVRAMVSSNSSASGWGS